MATDMFYGASPEIFRRAKELRANLTPAESVLWMYLNRNQLNGFRFKSQHPIHTFIADFYCHSARLVIELDGGVHDSLEQQIYDSNRTYLITEFGLTIVRFRNDEVLQNIQHVIETIRTYLNKASYHPYSAQSQITILKGTLVTNEISPL